MGTYHAEWRGEATLSFLGDATLIDQGTHADGRRWATLHVNPDLHNYTGWRDAFHPHLTRLLARVWA